MYKMNNPKAFAMFEAYAYEAYRSLDPKVWLRDNKIHLPDCNSLLPKKQLKQRRKKAKAARRARKQNRKL